MAKCCFTKIEVLIRRFFTILHKNNQFKYEAGWEGPGGAIFTHICYNYSYDQINFAYFTTIIEPFFAIF